MTCKGPGGQTFIDITMIDNKIAEVQQLLGDLFKMKQYFENQQMNGTQTPLYFA